MLVQGEIVLDVEEWEKFAQVRGGGRAGGEEKKAKEVAGWFFGWLRGASPQDRARILAFATGSSRLPPGGWKALKDAADRPAPFVVLVDGDPAALPSAHTCSNLLVLPPVDARDMLEERLELVLSCSGREMHLV